MKTILILSDSLNRNYLPIYGNRWVKTPNIDRLAARSVVFDNHWIGSAPCMPARRDMMTGRLHFLERDWGGLEPFDHPYPSILRRNGVFSHMETDHYHYFHVGGENYHTPFSTWILHRGQENDVYNSIVTDLPEPEHLGKWGQQYAKNRMRFDKDADYSSPKTFAGATEWLRTNASSDNWHLWVEAFDPHEPFDCPREYLDMYDDNWDGPLYNWSGYSTAEENSEATRHLRRCYAATVTMMDRWLGRMLDELERQGQLEDTLIVFTTDHGHMLGEKGVTGKNRWHAWNQMAHIPLVVHLPGDAHAGERRSRLTQNTDIMPTLLDYYGIPPEHAIHGESWRPVLEDNAPQKRSAALYGWFGQSVNVTDGEYTYLRAPVLPGNEPLYRHFLTHSAYGQHDLCGRDWFDEAQLGRFLPWHDFPVLRSPARRGYRKHDEFADTRLHSVTDDWTQDNNLAGSPIERKYEKLLVDALVAYDSPPEQSDRLGLARE